MTYSMQTNIDASDLIAISAINGIIIEAVKAGGMPGKYAPMLNLAITALWTCVIGGLYALAFKDALAIGLAIAGGATLGYEGIKTLRATPASPASPGGADEPEDR